MKRLLKRGAAIVCALACIAVFSTTALAYTTIDTSRETSLTIAYGDGKAISGANFELYRVADVSDRVYYTLSGDFQNYSVRLNGLDSGGWRAAAETLAAYAQRDDLTPLRSGKTDSQGRLTFGKLNVGLFLVVGERYRVGRYTYTPEPMLVLLPGIDGDDRWVYDLTAFPKYEENYRPGGGGGGGGDDDTITRKVLKVWEDDQKKNRPKEIVVQLLRDGRVFDTVTLSKKNNWRYTWTELDDDYVWRVVEYDVPEGYTVSIGREGITFVITNTYEPETPPDEPNIPDTPPPLGPDPGDPGNPDNPGNPGKPGLPQTGMLWWPVPLLAGAGILLFMGGWHRMRKEERDEE